MNSVKHVLKCLCGLFRVSGLSKTELTTKFDRVVTHLRLESKKVVDKQWETDIDKSNITTPMFGYKSP